MFLCSITSSLQTWKQQLCKRKLRRTLTRLINKNDCSVFPESVTRQNDGRFLYLWSFPCSRSDLKAGTRRDRRTCSGTNVELQSCRRASSPSVPAPLFLSFLVLVTQGASAAWKIKRRDLAAGLLCHTDLMRSWKLSDEEDLKNSLRF